MQPARTRIAPSPTGYIHIGTLRTALYCYLLSRQTGGQFLIRIEDTDRERLVEGAAEHVLETLTALGIDYDEGPVVEQGVLVDKGDKGPYVQSQRLDLYKTYVDQLLDQGDAYHCFCTKERLDQMREEQRATKQTPKYDRTCCQLSEQEVQAKLADGEAHVVRMKVPEGETSYEDIIRGTLKVSNAEVDDQVIMKSDGFPTYHLAVVVDDHLMEISHILRGEEWIPSTPKHVMLYKMLGWQTPQFAHLPLLLNPDKTKLSKRQGDVAVEDYLKRGYLPQALLNFVALLGFNPKGDQELYSMEELIELFDLTKVNKSGAVLNMEKLDWMNNHYLKDLSREELLQVAQPFLQADTKKEVVARALLIERERAHRLDELQEKIQEYITEPSYDGSILVWKKSDAASAKEQLTQLLPVIEGLDDSAFDRTETLETEIKAYIQKQGLGNGEVLWPLRTALSGKARSASPFDFLWALGREEATRRVTHAINLL